MRLFSHRFNLAYVASLCLLLGAACTAKKNSASLTLQEALISRGNLTASQAKVGATASLPAIPAILRACPGFSGDDIQNCINASNPGDVIVLSPGQTYFTSSKIIINKSGITLTTGGNPDCYATNAGQAVLTGRCATILASPFLSFASSSPNVSANGGVLQVGPDILWTDVAGINQYLPPRWQNPVRGNVIQNIVIDGNKAQRPADNNRTGIAACRYESDGLPGYPIMGQLGCANLRINNCTDCVVKNIVTVDAAVIKTKLVVNLYANLAFNTPNFLFQNNLVWNRTMVPTANGGTWDWTLNNGFEFDEISNGSDLAPGPFSGSVTIAGNTAIDYADGQLVLAGSPGSRIFGRIYNNTVTNNRRILVPDGSRASGAMEGGGILVYAHPLYSYYGQTDLNLGEGSTNDPAQTLVVSYNIVNDPHGVNGTGLAFSGNNPSVSFATARIRGGIITANYVIGGRGRSYRLSGTGPTDGQWLPPYTYFTSNVAEAGFLGEVVSNPNNFSFCHSAGNPIAFLSTTVANFGSSATRSCTGTDIWGGACPGTTVGYLYGNPTIIRPYSASLMGWHDEGSCTND